MTRPTVSAPATAAMGPRQRLALAAILLTGAAVSFAPLAASQTGKAAVIVILAIGLWTTGWIPEWLTALVFFTLCMMGKVAPAAVVFAGFASSATWLVLAGAVIGGAIVHTGLGDRLAGRLAPMIGRSFIKAVMAVVLFGVGLTFAMPSAMGRVMLMLPLVDVLATRLGYPRASRGHRGIVLAGVFGTYLPAFAVLPANIPNNVFVGTVEVVLGTAPTYGQYLLLHFPVLGLLKIILIIPLILWLYRDTPQEQPDEETAQTAKASPDEIHLAVLLVVAVALWATDGWHGIPAAWIGMLVAVWCLYPGSGLMGPRPFSSLRFEPVFYVAGIVSLGVIADQSGLGTRIATWALSVLPLEPNAPAQTFGILSGLSTLVGLAVTLPGVPPVMTPLITPLAAATHWSPLAVAMTQVIGFSTVLLPYQAPPLVVARQSSGLTTGDVTRMCLLTAAVTIVLLWPLDYVWWRALGWTS